MPTILIVDDEPLFHKLITHSLKILGYQLEFALNGREGLEKANEVKPDVIISDVMMPEMSGYEMTKRLRRDPRFGQTPILMLTTQAELGDKLKAFEAGADDYMSKPFEPAELIARLSVLLRRSEAVRAIETKEPAKDITSKVICLHSLRGGVGCSSMSVNIAAGLQQLWTDSVIVVDTVMTAGQVALMLNVSLRRTWYDIAKIAPDEIDYSVVKTIIGKHDSGLDFLVGPTSPEEAEVVSSANVAATLDVLRECYEYIVIDMPHDFSENSLHALDKADEILLMIAPEMASVRAAAAAMGTYQKLGYDMQKVKLVMNNLFKQPGLQPKQIEKALASSLNLTVPYASQQFLNAINLGQPFLYGEPLPKMAEWFEVVAFRLSKTAHTSSPPAVPSESWQRVTRRLKKK